MKASLLAYIMIFWAVCGKAQWVKTNSPNSGGINCFVNTGSYFFAGTDSAGAFLSTDNGDNWAIAASGLTNKSVKSLTSIGNSIIAGTYGNGVFLSSDQGSNWTASSSGLGGLEVNTLLTSGSDIFAGTDSGIFISSDQGANWSGINSGLSTKTVVALAANGTKIFAGTSGGGMFLSSDNGNSWKAINSGLSSDSVSAIAISGSNIYAGTNSSGVFVSSDNGNSWTSISSGLTNTHVWALVPIGTHMFAATGGGGKKGSGTGGGNGMGKGKGGVFANIQSYSTWSPVNTGLPKTDVRSLYTVGSDIFAGTADSNVWKRSIAELLAGIPELNKEEIRLSIYPNPASSDIVIEYPDASKSELVICNIFGEHVFVNTTLPNQQGKYVLDISGWKNGVYFLKLDNHIEKIVKE